MSDLQECQKQKDELRQNAESLAEKYEEAKDKQSEIMHRYEVVKETGDCHGNI